jgi:hypothetical protein
MSTPTNNFRYTVRTRLVTLFAAPLGESDFTIEWTREDTAKLNYKRAFPSKITFTGEVYQNLLVLEKSIYRCEYVLIDVERRCTVDGTENWVPWFTGRLSFNQGEWDLDACKVEITASEINIEQCYEDNKGQEINILAGRSTFSVFLNPPGVTIEKITYTIADTLGGMLCAQPYYWAGGGAPADLGWVMYAYSTEKHFDGSNICNVSTSWARETISLPCGSPSPGTEWILIGDTCPGGSQTYARPARLFACNYTTPDYSDTIQTTAYSCLIVSDSSTTVLSINNGVKLNDLLEYFIASFCPGLQLVSNFFQINPDVVSTINYVTGQPSKVLELFLFQKSDVKRPAVSGDATIANISFEKLLTDLVEMFNLRWRIEGSKFLLEHVSFFSSSPGLDLTLPKWQKFVSGKKQYTYKISEIPVKETFSFMEASFGDFQGKDIVYGSACVTNTSIDNVKQHKVENITTDVELVLGNPDSDSSVVSDDGFVLMATAFDGTNYYIITEAPMFSGHSINNTLSWAHLHRDYHKYERALIMGNMNALPTLFLSVAPTKKGTTLEIPLCCTDDFNPDQTVRTDLGVGIVEKAVFSFRKQTLQLDLVYNAQDGLTQNLAPIAHFDTVVLIANSTKTINVLNNDIDPDAQPLRVFITFPPAHGIAFVDSSQNIVYTPNAGYTGPDEIVYILKDVWNEPSNAANVSLTVIAAITATDDNYTTNQDTALIKAALDGIFANDVDSLSFTLASYDAASVHGGTVVVNPDGAFTYTPAAGYFGPDSFTYTITDATLATDTATVNITVLNANNPIAADDSYQTRKTTNLIVTAPGLLANDSTTVGSLTVTAETLTTDQGGSVVIAADGSFVYTPPTGFSGIDNFNYTASNGTGIDVGRVTIRVLPDIFIRLEQTSTSINNVVQDCGGTPTIVGQIKSGVFRLFFYSDSAAVTPLDVTGLQLHVNYKVTSTPQSGPPSDTNRNLTPAGISYDLYNGTYYRNIQNCGGITVFYQNDSFSLLPGLYTII